MHMLTPDEAVANGAQLLDEKYPGWYEKIDLEHFWINSTIHCVCGQLARQEDMRWDMFANERLGSPAVYAREWGTWVEDHGFCERWQDANKTVTTAWKEAIHARREADRLPAPEVKREEVYA